MAWWFTQDGTKGPPVVQAELLWAANLGRFCSINAAAEIAEYEKPLQFPLQ